MPKVSAASVMTVALAAAALRAGLALGSGPAAVSPCAPAGWPQPRQSSCAAGSVADAALSPSSLKRFGLAWAANLGGAAAGVGVAVGQPIAAAGRVYVVSNWPRPRLFALDLATGRIRWSASAGASFGQPEFLTPVVDGRVLLRLSSANALRRYDQTTGRILWHGLAIGPEGSPGEQVAADGRWYWSSGEELQALGESRGNTIWRRELNCFHCGVAASNGRVFAGGSIDPMDSHGKLSAFDGRTGKTLWQTTAIGDLTTAASAMLVADTVLVLTMKDHSFFLEAFHAADGQPLWHTQVCTAKGYWFQAAAADSNVVVYPCTDGVVYALDTQTGAVRWKHPLETPDQFTSPALSNGIVWEVDGTRLVALSEDDGHALWRSRRFTSDGSGPIVAGGTVLVGTGDGQLLAFRAR